MTRLRCAPPGSFACRPRHHFRIRGDDAILGTQAGAGFFLSGVVNVFLLGTPQNVMAFTMPNVVFSWVVGAVLVALG